MNVIQGLVAEFDLTLTASVNKFLEEKIAGPRLRIDSYFGDIEDLKTYILEFYGQEKSNQLNNHIETLKRSLG